MCAGRPLDSNAQTECAPHEGRELELMLQGNKPLALFFDTIPECGVIPEDQFEDHVRNRTLIKAEKVISPLDDRRKNPSTRVVLYARPEERWRIREALEIVEPVFALQRPPTDDDDILLGRLLGYTEGEISRFVGGKHGLGSIRQPAKAP